MLRKIFMKNHISAGEIHHVIGHNATIYFKLVLQTIGLLLVLYFVYEIISGYTDLKYLSWIFAFLGLVWFGRFVITFLNHYLDGLALSSSGLTLFMREGLLEYKTEYFDWDKISTISHNQKGIWDKVFQKGDIIIYVEHDIQFPFENVTAPKKQVDKIMRLKNYHSINKHKESTQQQENSASNEDQKLNILVEALSEVVKEYIDKKDTKSETEGFKHDFF